MSELKTGQPPLDMKLFLKNERKFPPEELARYAGKHVAYSGDGTRILASGDSLEALEKELAATGYDASQVVFSYVWPPDLSYI